MKQIHKVKAGLEGHEQSPLLDPLEYHAGLIKQGGMYYVQSTDVYRTI